jgi:hypothetical protein
MQNLTHPNILRVHGACLKAPRLCLVVGPGTADRVLPDATLTGSLGCDTCLKCAFSFVLAGDGVVGPVAAQAAAHHNGALRPWPPVGNRARCGVRDAVLSTAHAPLTATLMAGLESK